MLARIIVVTGHILIRLNADFFDFIKRPIPEI
jgi:hypothetical protein